MLLYHFSMRVLLAACLSVAFLPAGYKPTAGPVEFRLHDIETNIPGGYTVIVADMNHDGRPDVLGMTQRLNELAWYENPTWERHVIIKDMPTMVNLAAWDIDGD